MRGERNVLSDLARAASMGSLATSPGRAAPDAMASSMRFVASQRFQWSTAISWVFISGIQK
jgi:hypothetical protein